jgi:hypothetical protein
MSFLSNTLSFLSGTLTGVDVDYYFSSSFEGEISENGQNRPYNLVVKGYNIHANNIGRGFYKIQQDFSQITLFNIGLVTAMHYTKPIRNLSTIKRCFVQIVLVNTISSIFGIYKGCQPIQTN